jgi:dTMP kinase
MTTRRGLFIVFEGIDGSGKTTISNQIAGRLREQGLVVEHAREGGAFASSVTQGIRDFCRDARNLAITPRAELLLYVAREVQLLEEVIAPALARADVVIADRYLYTAEVLARAGRGLPDDAVRPILESAARGLWPDLAFLIDVDPSVARGRRKVAKILSRDIRPASRKGLTGGGLQFRLRQGYLDAAASDPGRWMVLDNTDADLPDIIGRVMATIDRVRSAGTGAPPAPPDVAALPTRPAAGSAIPAPGGVPVDDPKSALAALLGWVDRRAEREPALSAYVLAGTAGPGIDERRLALAARAPQVMARGLRGLSDEVSWRLRRTLVEAAPDEVAASLVDDAAEAPAAWTLRELLVGVAAGPVAASLTGLDDETAWALRADLYALAPDAVMASLAMLDGPRAWGLRERWIAERGGLDPALAGYPGARAAARAVTGLDDERAWAVRKAARGAAPVAALSSLRGLGSDKAWRWRERAIAHAPKAVLATIAGLDEERAWAMRVASAPACREALDSMIGLDHPVAWEIRESALESWPASVIKSLGVLVNGAPGRELVTRALLRFPANISLLKQAAMIATGAHLTPAVLAA